MGGFGEMVEGGAFDGDQIGVEIVSAGRKRGQIYFLASFFHQVLKSPHAQII